ncbi:hypothetical protein CEUSTIGMA_g5189.t1 [Chlamydomonas eustigma]|uniref:Uncharacterized protein n=1 Tax=Chlamydomonas eustigma TaxID=1157962 RepID=A0A250X3W5_9CHLO|nr:hypothetical protein CEUSTIGMA_g5189.t1 [Chlamydomonas eustigma]|eukprot:GAX77746.1 hypothetical protein CEUSTIGMA_g5189.t1 [Chlamydomonas eustigma]
MSLRHWMQTRKESFSKHIDLHVEIQKYSHRLVTITGFTRNIKSSNPPPPGILVSPENEANNVNSSGFKDNIIIFLALFSFFVVVLALLFFLWLHFCILQPARRRKERHQIPPATPTYEPQLRPFDNSALELVHEEEGTVWLSATSHAQNTSLSRRTSGGGASRASEPSSRTMESIGERYYSATSSSIRRSGVRQVSEEGVTAVSSGGFESFGNEFGSNASLGGRPRAGVTSGSVSSWYSAVSVSEGLRTGASSSPQIQREMGIPMTKSDSAVTTNK